MERTTLSCSRSLAKLLHPNCVRTCPTRSFTIAVPQALSRTAPVKHTHASYHRCIHTTTALCNASKPPRSRDRGPQSTETTQTDFAALDVLRNTAAPATAIDACTSEGFALDNGAKISGSGLLLIGGEAFRWRPWLQAARKEETVAGGGVGDDAMAGRLLNAKRQWEVPNSVWGLLDLVYPKPDLLIIGTGPHVTPIAPSVRRHLNDLGIRLEIQDTRNAAAQFNLLATERGVGQVAAALVPIGWREGR